MNPYENIELVCVACKNPFTWTSGEQEFLNDLAQKGKINAVIQPRRCSACRKINKENRERNKI